VRWLAVNGHLKRRDVERRLPEVCIAGAALASNAEKTQRDYFANSWRNGVPMDAVFLKIIERHAQANAHVPGMMAQLDRHAIEHATS